MRNGFSLVELSIVLVILGLLTGGILAGQSLIRASELRAVSTEYGRYVTAMGAFRDKYFALPGDIANATKFWGTAANCPGTATQGSTTATTCNGDGNGIIWEPLNANQGNEVFRFWQHLANVGLIEGSYSGVTADNAADYAAGANNSPRSKLNSAQWSVYDDGSYGNNTISNTMLFEGETYNNNLGLGKTVAGDYNNDPILKPEEAWNIDTKMDDGKPGRGLVRVWEMQTNCHDATPSNSVAVGATANYRLNNTSLACSFLFRPN